MSGIRKVIAACRAVAPDVSESEILFAAAERLREAGGVRRASGFLIKTLPDCFSCGGLHLVREKIARVEEQAAEERLVAQEEAIRRELMAREQAKADARQEKEAAARAEREALERKHRELRRRAEDRLNKMPTSERDQLFRTVEEEILHHDPDFHQDGRRLREEAIKAQAIRRLMDSEDAAKPSASVLQMPEAAEAEQ